MSGTVAASTFNGMAGFSSALPLANGGAAAGVSDSVARIDHVHPASSVASVAFNAIMSGTNTTATMVVGSGGSLSYSGTGVINASTLAGYSISSFTILPASVLGWLRDDGAGARSWTTPSASDVGADPAGTASSAVSAHASLRTGIHGISITTGKTFSAANTLAFSGTDGSALNIGTGGTLGTGAYAIAYVLPTATASVLGGVKPDGISILNTAGALSVTPTSIGLGNVENTALSTWAGSTALTTLGTIATGIWNSTKIALGFGGTNADLSATGGASHVLRQLTVGAAITVSQLTAADIINVPAGALVALNVQGALNELDSGKVASTRTINTTAPLTGGGALANDLTIAMPAATGLVSGYLSATTQTIGGAKTFSSLLTASAGITIAGALIQTHTMSGAGSSNGVDLATIFQNTAGTSRGLKIVATSSPSGASTAATVGLEGSAEVSATATILSSGVMVGMNSVVRVNAGTAIGTITSVRAGYYFVQNNNAAVTITTATSCFIDAPSAAGPITNAYGIYIANQRQTGVTASYALSIAPQTGGGYAILCEGAGRVRVLDTTAATSTTTGALAVTGGAGIGGALWVGGLLNVAGAFTTQSLTLNGVSSISGLINGVRFYTGSTDANMTYPDVRYNGTNNLIISAVGAGAIYLNHDHGTGGVNFSNGVSVIVASISSTGGLSATTGLFSGILTVLTAAPGTNTTQAASTAFVTAAVAAGGGGAGGSGDLLHALLTTEVAITTTANLNFGIMHVCSGTTADYTVALPAASGNAGKFVGVRTDGTSVMSVFLTVDGNAAELIDGASTRIMWAGESAILLCDGVGWKKVAGKTRPLSSSLGSTTAATFSASTLTKLNYNFSVYNTAPASMQDAANKRIYIRRPGVYKVTCQQLLNSTNSTAHYNQTYIHLDGIIYKGAFHYQNASALTSSEIFSTDAFNAGSYLEIFYIYDAGSFTTSVLYVDSTANYSQFTVVEQPMW